MRRSLSRHVVLAVLLSLPVAASAQHAARAGAAHAVSPVVATLARMESSMRSTRYVHATRIDPRAGRYDMDCSAMAAWVLARATPVAHAAVLRRNGRGRPVARDFHDVIAAAPTEHPRDGWQRLASPVALRAGDVIAWRTPAGFVTHNTGHVAFVAAPARALDREGRRFLVRITDATSIPHGDDTRPRVHRTGFGHGTLMLYRGDPRGEVTAFGWYGLPTRIDFYTHVALGRAVR